MISSSVAKNVLILTALVVLLPACRQAIVYRKIDEKTWFQREQRSVLDSRELSERTHQFLRREALLKRHGKEADAVIAELNGRLQTIIATPAAERRPGSRFTAFHLSELCFQRGLESQDPSGAEKCFFSAALYAYAFLFEPELGSPISGFDPAFRLSCDLYNRALARLIPIWKNADRKIAEGDKRIDSFVGPVPISLATDHLRWDLDEYDSLVVAFDFEVVGLPGLTREFGLGVPIIAIKKVTQAERLEVPEAMIRTVSPATAIIRFDGALSPEGPAPAACEIYEPNDTDSIRIGDRDVPLEGDLTAALAFVLSRVKDTGGFFSMLQVRKTEKLSGLFMMRDFEPQRIPVILVHGLMSNPLTWIPLLNDLAADPTLRKRCQVWFFRYPTGNPILVSAAALRSSLKGFQRHYDPDGTLPAFQHSIIVGHSMGGLVSKMQILSSGDRLWNLISDDPLDSLDLPEEDVLWIRELLYFERLSFIRRAVFMSVPHRGSDFATNWIGRLGDSLVDLPDRARQRWNRLETRMEGRIKEESLRSQSTGISDLRPDSRFLLSLATWAFDQDLTLHSIIGDIDGPGPKETDGIVPYSSSHLDGVESELIIESGHGTHRSNEAIVELRRILHLHVREFDRRQEEREKGR